jgi:uncharacterized protein
MAFGYSVELPLRKDNEDGFYVLTKTMVQNIKQNFKNLLLTVPGERVMVPGFGAGLRNYLFHNNSPDLHSEITDKIRSQVETYMPFLTINTINFQESSAAKNGTNKLYISISYFVPSLKLHDTITVT